MPNSIHSPTSHSHTITKKTPIYFVSMLYSVVTEENDFTFYFYLSTDYTSESFNCLGMCL